MFLDHTLLSISYPLYLTSFSTLSLHISTRILSFSLFHFICMFVFCACNPLCPSDRHAANLARPKANADRPYDHSCLSYRRMTASWSSDSLLIVWQPPDRLTASWSSDNLLIVWQHPDRLTAYPVHPVAIPAHPTAYTDYPTASYASYCRLSCSSYGPSCPKAFAARPHLSDHLVACLLVLNPSYSSSHGPFCDINSMLDCCYLFWGIYFLSGSLITSSLCVFSIFFVPPWAFFSSFICKFLLYIFYLYFSGIKCCLGCKYIFPPNTLAKEGSDYWSGKERLLCTMSMIRVVPTFTSMVLIPLRPLTLVNSSRVL